MNNVQIIIAHSGLDRKITKEELKGILIIGCIGICESNSTNPQLMIRLVLT